MAKNRDKGEEFRDALEDSEREIKDEKRMQCMEMFQFFLDNQDLLFEMAPKWEAQRAALVNGFENIIRELENYEGWGPDMQAYMDDRSSKAIETYWDFYQTVKERASGANN